MLKWWETEGESSSHYLIGGRWACLAHCDLWLCRHERRHTLFWDYVWVGECRFGSRFGIHQGWGKKKEVEGQTLVLASQPYFISLEQRIEADCTYSMSSQVMTVSWFGLYLLPNYYRSLLIRDLLLVFYCNFTKNNVMVIALNSVLCFCFLSRTESSVLHFGQALTCTYIPSDHFVCSFDTTS